jgi:hypothetical protein
MVEPGAALAAMPGHIRGELRGLRKSVSSCAMLLLLAIAIVSAALWHWWVPVFIVAVVGATITSIVLFQIESYLELGYLDSFFEVAIVTSGAIALPIAVLIGLPFRVQRKRQPPR